MKLESQFVIAADTPNANGRIYTKECLEQVVAKFKKDGTMLGELEASNKASVSFSQVSHVVDDIRLVDNNLVADITVLDTPCGEKLKELLSLGEVSFHLKGVGGVDYAGNVNSESYKLISISVKKGE